MSLATSIQSTLDSALFVNVVADAGMNKGIARAILALIVNYQLAFIERWFFGSQKMHQKINSRLPQHLYHIICAVVIMLWNCAEDSKHMLICVLAQYAILKIGTGLNARKLALAVTWVFQMGYYLKIGIFADKDYADKEYGFTWTTPHCVLVLRCIMLATDVYDGGKSEKLLKWDQKETSLKKSPGFIETVAYMAYYGAVLIGPQFTLSHYRNFIDGKYIKKCKETFFAETRKLAIQKLVLGVALVGLYGVVGPMLSVEHLKENAFFERSLPSRIGYIYIMGWLQFYKYLSMWLISEGALILAGVGTVETKNRKTQELVLDHSQCENVKVGLITTCNVMLEFVDGFNINTNKWVMNYCFKRLAFLGNKNVSQLASLAFLALWHGFNFGYFTCFFYEFMTIFAEKELLARGILVRGYKGNKFRAILQKFVQVHTIGAYCMIDFNLLEWQAFWPVWKSVFFYGHLLVVFEILLVFMLPKNKVQKKE